MKKNLLSFLFIFLLGGILTAQSKMHSGFEPAKNPGSKNNHAKTSQLNAIVTTTTTSCMSINLPAPPTWSLVNYGTGGPPFAASGFANGVNTYNDKEKAMFFDASATANTMLTQVYVAFDHAYTATPSKTVAIRIYSATASNGVGPSLGQATLSMATIMNNVTNNQYSLVMFPTPINLPASKKFFVSVDVSGLSWSSTPKDSLSIISNQDPQTNPTPVWEKQSNNVWYSYSNTSFSWGLNISLLIHPFLTQAPITASITASQNTICAGQSINYSTTGSTAGTYEWSFGAIPTSTAAGPTAAPFYPSAGTYTTLMIVEDACGSFGIAQHTLLVNPNPVVTASPSSTSVCQGGSVTLSGGGANTYTWSGGITNNTAFAPASSGGYTVTGTATNQCTANAVANVIVNPNPAVTANATTTMVCSGSSVTLNGGGASTYSWTGGVINGTAFIPSGPNTYTVTGTSSANCTGTAVISLTLVPNPTVTANATATMVCSGSSVTLNGGGASTYSWTGGVINGAAFVPAGPDTYTVTGTSTTNCNGTAVISVTVVPNPTITVNVASQTLCAGSSATLSGSGANSYTWTGGISNGVSFTPANTATYVVTGADLNGCEGNATAIVVVDPCTGIKNHEANPTVSIYPNPSSQEFIVVTDQEASALALLIYNALGELIYSQDLKDNHTVINKDFPAGIYILRISENGKIVSTQKIIRK